MIILCVTDSLGSWGAQHQLVKLAFYFKETRHDVSFLTYHHVPQYNLILEKKCISISCTQEPNDLKRLLKMRSIIRRDNMMPKVGEREEMVSPLSSLLAYKIWQAKNAA